MSNEININQNIITTIQGLYRQSKAKIKVGQRLWKDFLVDKRLCQGCCTKMHVERPVAETVQYGSECCRLFIFDLADKSTKRIIAI